MNIMFKLDILSAEATAAQIELNSVKTSNKSVSKKAEKTFMNHSIIRNNALTDTARLDFVLSTCFVLTDFHVTAQQCVAFAASVNLDSKRLQSAAQIVKHCKDDDICEINNSVLSISDERLKEFYVNAFYSQAHMLQLKTHASDLFSLIVNSISDAQHIEYAELQAYEMHSEFIANAKKAARKTKKAAK